MPFNSPAIDKKTDEAIDGVHILIDIAGVAFPPLAIVASDMQAAIDLYKFIEAHVSNKPGLAWLPGPPLRVRNPLDL